MMDSEAEENIELDEFEAFKFRACSPRLISRQLERLDSEEDPTETRTSLPNFTSNKHGENGSQGEKDSLLTKPAPRALSPNRLKFDRLGSGGIPGRPDNFRLGRSLSCKPRSKPKRVEGVSPMRGRDRINSLVGELNALSRHGSLTGSGAITPNVVYEEGVEIYRVRSFTTTHKGFLNRGDSFKIRSPACRRSMIRHRQDSIATLNLAPGGDADVDSAMDNFPTLEELQQHLQEAEERIAEEGDDDEPDTIPTIYKVLLFGASEVGKTSLKQQFMTSEYLGNADNLPGKAMPLELNFYVYVYYVLRCRLFYKIKRQKLCLS